MAFENVYLTPEEQEQFAKRAIPPYISPLRRAENYLGTDGWPNPKCTADKERCIYLFSCGMGDYDFETPPDEYYFALVWDDITGDSRIGIILKMDSLSIESPGVLWHSLSMEIPPSLESKRELLIETIKEALEIYGRGGNPKIKGKYVVKFGF